MPRKRRAADCRVRLLLGLLAAGLLISGCSRRRHYQRAADRNTYNILKEKTVERPWELHHDYSVLPDARSRLHDPSSLTDPALPHPGPNLYTYELPEFARSPDQSEDLEELPDGQQPDGQQPLAPRADPDAVPPKGPDSLPRPSLEPPSPLQASAAEGVDASDLVRQISTVRLANAERYDDPPPPPEPVLPRRVPDELPPYAEVDEGVTIQPIPPDYWDRLPPECLSRMLEFQTVRDEYSRTFGAKPSQELRDQSVKLSFESIVQLAYLNSREYQTQKETLYRAALALTLERFDYMCKFSPFGNSVDVNYDHVRSNGFTVNSLTVPSSLRLEKMTALGGTIVTQFANNVLLTFNGPSGFAKDVNSNLLFEFTQSVLQRDVLLEPLIQSERNVIYAARTYTRFRKQFFVALAQTYYQDLLSTYRQVEINTQNYFSLVRQLEQSNAELRSGILSGTLPRVEIDQFEQNMLASRSQVISTCNNLETSLDRLKLQLGLPTEMPINIDLRELETLTQRDEVEVRGELIRRAQDRVELELSDETPDREDVISASVVLLDRILEWLPLRRQLGQEGVEDDDVRLLRAQLRVDEGYEILRRPQQLLNAIRQSEPPAAPVNVFQAVMNNVEARLNLVARQLQLYDVRNQPYEARDGVLSQFVQLKASAESIQRRVLAALSGDDEDVRLDQLQAEAENTLRRLAALDAPARRMIGAPPMRPDRSTELRQAVTQGRDLLQRIDQLASDAEAGLAEIEISFDEAMATSLVQRFELMNERGLLADDWRAIKLAADDLKSRLNLNVRQSFQTRNNRPFAFTFADSRTQVRGTLDLPLNRRQQRNTYRRSLINYQAGRRSLMALEDNIKFTTRQDLRQLALDRVQYEIDVISAALASERVVSTQLEISLGLTQGRIRARDFLEAQRAFRLSVTSVANGRLGYIVNRAQLALDLELIMLDDTGMWSELNNDDYQPFFAPIYPANAGPTYGDLPRRVWPTRKIKRQLLYPLPGYRETAGPEGSDGASNGVDGGAADGPADAAEASVGGRSSAP